MNDVAMPKSARAVMASRIEPPDSLEFFPTPPWATRALMEHVLGRRSLHEEASWDAVAKRPRFGTARQAWRCWEPAAGEGHMAAVLAEYFDEVYCTDVHDYGGLHAVGSFIGADGLGLDVVEAPSPGPAWIITNPPFSLAVEFVERALVEAKRGVAILVRTQWLEGVERYIRLLSGFPPAIVAPFAERVPMHEGRWDPNGSTATAYAWIVWRRLPRLTGEGLGAWSHDTRMVWIPPGCRVRLEHPDDRRRFAAASVAAGEARSDADLFDEIAETASTEVTL